MIIFFLVRTEANWFFYCIEVSTEDMIFNVQLCCPALLIAMWGTKLMWPCKIGFLHSSATDVNNNLLLKVVQAWTVWKKKIIHFHQSNSHSQTASILQNKKFSPLLPNPIQAILWEHPEQAAKLYCIPCKDSTLVTAGARGSLASCNEQS